MKVKNFKIFQDEQTLVLREPIEDSYNLTVIVGKNGSGKSSTFDAIDWAVFNRSPRSMRASNQDSLIAVGKSHMYVNVTIQQQNGDAILEIKRELYRGKQPLAFAKLTYKDEFTGVCIDQELYGMAAVTAVLHSRFELVISHLERIMIKQENVSSISCADPNHLLSLMENFIGSDKINDAANACVINRNSLSLERSALLKESNLIRSSIKEMLPSLDKAIILQSQEHELNNSFLKLFNAEIRKLKIKEAVLVDELQLALSTNITIANEIHSTAMYIDTYDTEIKSLKLAEEKKLRDMDTCKRSINQMSENMESNALTQKRASNTSSCEARKIRGLLKSVNFWMAINQLPKKSHFYS
jgi:DNA repair exonuclease SbcCD ATPase subunit